MTSCCLDKMRTQRSGLLVVEQCLLCNVREASVVLMRARSHITTLAKQHFAFT